MTYQGYYQVVFRKSCMIDDWICTIIMIFTCCLSGDLGCHHDHRSMHHTRPKSCCSETVSEAIFHNYPNNLETPDTQSRSWYIWKCLNLYKHCFTMKSKCSYWYIAIWLSKFSSQHDGRLLFFGCCIYKIINFSLVWNSNQPEKHLAPGCK